MDRSRPLIRSHVFVAVVVATRAIPRIVSRVMSGAMQKGMMRLGGEGCDPEAM